MQKILISTTLMLVSFLIFLAFPKGGIAMSLLSGSIFWVGVGLTVLPKVGWGKGKLFLVPFLAYFLYHSLLYSFTLTLLEPGGLALFNYLHGYHFGYGYEIPPPPQYFLLWVSQSVGIWFIIGNFEADVVPFTLFMGLLLGDLMGLNVSEITKLRGVGMKTATAITLPSLGVVSGTSCCLALPSLILYSVALSVPVISSEVFSLLSSTPYFVFVYFGLPIMSAVILYLNLRLVRQVKLKKSLRDGTCTKVRD
ncbi:hypothetical protein GWK48_09660 [Metallosphaera tengchongensis]|uniref:Uncharacterized protein n=1 Tax=Metallosphaera tengchongensis TaxID=1532350 RepID=A0A6N0NZX8_9CREN|nr:hypothetical protein [Metallosphaera tengchongensis]QKR00610.1 hypothetical protein GWK48_09660 [Metallosphaera tengchongensis]